MANVIALNGATPGPTAALIVANSRRYGLWHGLVTALGTTGALPCSCCSWTPAWPPIVELAASVLWVAQVA